MSNLLNLCFITLFHILNSLTISSPLFFGAATHLTHNELELCNLCYLRFLGYNYNSS